MASAGYSEPSWRKSTLSGTSACLEVASIPAGKVLLRDSKAPDGPVLQLTRAEWAAFREGVKAGEFDDF